MDSVGSVAILYMNAFTPPCTSFFGEDDVIVTSSSLVLVSSSDVVDEEEEDDAEVSLEAFMTVFVVLDDVAASTEENTAVSSAPAMRERNMMNRVVIRSAVVSSSFPSSKFPFAGLKTPWRAFCYIFERRYIVHNMRLFWPKKWVCKKAVCWTSTSLTIKVN